MTGSIPPRNGSEREPAETRAICATELIVDEYPEDGSEYRGLIRSYDSSGTVLFEQRRQRRRKPEWLVNVRHQRSGELELALQWRRQDDQSWQEVGRIALRPAAYPIIPPNWTMPGKRC